MKVKLNNVRLSFPDLFEAKHFDGKGAFTYGAQFLIEPGSAEDKAVEAALIAVAKEKWGAKATAMLAAAKASPQKICYVNGDTKGYEGYAGMMALSAKRPQNKGRPGVYDRDKSPLNVEDGKPYAGCFVNASVEFWAQDNSFGKALRCTLVGVQFAADGDAFSAGSKADPDDFDDMGEGSDADPLA
jgi:hypothetical protein